MEEPVIVTAKKPMDFLNRLTPQMVFALVAGFFGLACAVITPPVQVPDEAIQWYRTYQLSQGKFVARHYSGNIPNSIVDICAYYSTHMAFQPHVKTTPDETIARLKMPLNSRSTSFQLFEPTSLYSAVPYVPQTLAMLLARKMRWPALWLLYTGRVGTLIGYVLIGFTAIRILPILKWPACLILTNPMALILAGSLSADAVTIAMCFLALSLVLRAVNSQTPLSPAAVGGLALTMIAVGLCKSVYIPIVLLVLIIPLNRWGSGTWRWIKPVLIIVLALGTAAAWSALAKTGGVNNHQNTVHDRTMWVIMHPAQYIKIVRLSIAFFWTDLLRASVGIIGWYEIPLPMFVADCSIISLAWITLVYDGPQTLRAIPRIAVLLVYLASAGLVMTGVYVMWNPLHNYMVEGLQGRYFLPIALLPCVVFRRRGRYPAQSKWMLLLLSCFAVYTVWALIQRYYLPDDMFFKLVSGTYTASVK